MSLPLPLPLKVLETGFVTRASFKLRILVVIAGPMLKGVRNIGFPVYSSICFYLDHREGDTLFITRLGVFVNGPVVVQLTTSFTVLLRWLFEVCGSTPRVSEARMAVRH